MLIDFLLGILGPILGLLSLKLLGRLKTSRRQKFLVLLLSGLTFVFYAIFGLLDYSLEEGPEINLGVLQISYGISEVLLILLVIILPIALGIILILSLKNSKWTRRLAVLLALVLAIGSINFFQIYREVSQHHWDFEGGLYNNCLNDCEVQLQ